MKASYKRLWETLLNRPLEKNDLIEVAIIANYAFNKINSGKGVAINTLVKVCMLFIAKSNIYRSYNGTSKTLE